MIETARAEHRLLRLSEFMTDGSLAGMCASLSVLTGVTVELLDEQGQRVVHKADKGLVRVAGDPAWSLDPWSEARDVLGEVPIMVGGQPIATMRVSSEVAVSTELIGHLMTALSQLSRTAAEFCEISLAQRRGLDELGVLFDLTSLMVDGTDESVVLERALESALHILSLDAGSIVLLPEGEDERLGDDEHDLVLRGSVGLSEAWTASDETLSHNREFDRRALAGEVVTVEDLRRHDSVRIPEMVRAEGVVSFVCSGLLVRGAPLGVLRLYGLRPRTFNDTEQRLVRSIAQQAAASVHLARLLKLRRREREYERQMRMAAQVQQRMLPSGLPQFDGLDIAARYQPSFEVGGDFYDVFKTPRADRRKLGFAVGDVVGKGVPAAMLMASVRTSLRAHADSVSCVEEVMERVNRDITRDTDVGEFATIWYGVIDPVKLTLRYTSAGHPPTFIVRAAGREVEELTRGGLVAGIDEHAAYGSTTVQLGRGDTVVAYTDGIDEAMSFSGERFGKAGIYAAVNEALQRNAAASAADVIEHLFWSLRQFAGLQTRPDDATAVVIRVGM